MRAHQQKKITIDLWVPDLNQTGGVQEYSRCLASGLQDLAQVNLISLPSGGWLSKCQFLLQALKSLFKNRPNLIWCTHLHLARASFFARLFRTPLWISLHGIDCWNLTDHRDISSLKQASRLLAVSHYSLDRVAATFPDLKNKLDWLPNHLSDIPQFSSDKMAARQSLLLPQNALILLTVSRLSSQEKYKGHREVILALPALIKHFPDLHYVIAGSGDDLEELKLLATTQNCRGHVTFTGRLSHSELDQAYRAADLFVLVGQGEGFGIVILEALVRGIPVLASTADGSRDAVCNGELGDLVDPGDPDIIADKLQELLQNLASGQYPHSPENLRSEVIKAYGPDALQLRLSQLIETLQ